MILGGQLKFLLIVLTSYQAFFKSDCKRARPSLPRMISEGIILEDNGSVQSIKKEAAQLLEKGTRKMAGRDD